jgi:EpsI family protein
MRQKILAICLLLLFGNIGASGVISVGGEVRFDVKKLPLQFSGWKGYSVEVERFVMEVLETDQVYSFRYEKDLGSVGLTIVYYPKGQVAFHMPEGCAVGAGDKILDDSTIVLPGAWGDSSAKRFRVQDKMGNVTQQIYVFATERDAIGNYLYFRWHLLCMAIKEDKQSCGLIRIYTKETGGEVDSGTALLKRFWEQMSPFLRSAMSG